MIKQGDMVLFDQSELDAFTHGDTFDEEAFLAHHGVKGMKWGVRRAVGGVKKAYNVYDKAYNRAALDVTKGDLAKASRQASGKGLYPKLGKKIIGEKRMQSHLDKKVRDLKSEQRRIKNGKMTHDDIMRTADRITLGQIAAAGMQNHFDAKRAAARTA
jgi:hypothetical protein